MKQILLLGKGYIGSTLEKFLFEKNLKTMAFRRSEMDYTSPFVLQKFLNDHKDNFELIINCSGYTGAPNVDACENNKQDCWFWNVVVPKNIALAATTHMIPVFNISSGCIYDGYEKEYTEQDTPNFGLFSDRSSYYSKTKHACETVVQDLYVYTLRIRMPFDGTINPKNYLNKIHKYDNLISSKNSLTSVNDLYSFIFKLLFMYRQIPPGPLNVVNSGGVDAQQIVELLKVAGINNEKWNFISLENLQTKANRSNCVLSNEKIKSFNIALPDALESLERDISQLRKFFT